MSIFDKYSRIWNDGKRGFGKHSFNDAKMAGISNRELASALSGLRIGRIAQDNISRGTGTPEAFTRFARIWDDNQLGFGRESYQAARAAGFTNKQLSQGLSGYRVGKYANERITSGMKIEDLLASQQQRIADLQSQVVPAYQPAAIPKPQPPPEPKALTKSPTVVGGTAKGVKIKRSDAMKKGKTSRGTRALNRRQRAAAMQIRNLNP